MSEYVCLLAYLKNRMSKFLYMLPVAVAWSFSDDSAMGYVHPVLPILWMTSCLPIIGQAKARLVGRILSD